MTEAGAQRSQLRTVLFWTVFLLLPLIALEMLACGLYWVTHGVSRPPLLGGRAPSSEPIPDDFEFDPLTVFVNRDIPRHEHLHAKRRIELPERRPGEKRIFLVGGSTAANLRKPPDDRIAAHLEKHLRSRGLNARVFNFAVPSYTSTNELYLIAAKLVYLRPHLIVVYNGVNDAYYGSVIREDVWEPNITDLTVGYYKRMYTVQAISPYGHLVLAGKQLLYIGWLADRLVGALSEQRRELAMSPLAFAQHIERGSQRRVREDPVKLGAGSDRHEVYGRVARFNSKAAEVYLQNVRTAAAAASFMNVRFLHVLQPTALGKQNLHDREKWSIDYNNAYFPGFQDVMLRTFATYRRGLREMQRGAFRNDSNVHFLDLSQLTDQERSFLYDDFCHAYIGGKLTSLVGGAIGRTIVDNRLLHE